MTIFTKGQTIEVGVGEHVEDKDGGALCLLVDVDMISEEEVEKLVNDDILYITVVTDKQSVDWSKENPISEMMKKL